jgi:hypothetical protein
VRILPDPDPQPCLQVKREPAKADYVNKAADLTCRDCASPASPAPSPPAPWSAPPAAHTPATPGLRPATTPLLQYY